MLKCKICGKNLYSNITFSNVFKMNYIIHDECTKNLQFNFEEMIIPIESNIVIYDYVFKGFNDFNDREYMWFKYFGKLLDKHTKIKEWSIIIITDEIVKYFFKNHNPYLVLNLTNNPILIISFIEANPIYLEGL